MLSIVATIHGAGELLELKIDRPLFRGQSLVFENRNEASGVDFLEDVFNVNGITEIYLSEDLVRLRLSEGSMARETAREVGALLRKHNETYGENIIPNELVSKHNQQKKTDREDPQDFEQSEMSEQIKLLVANQVNPVLAEHKGYVEVLGLKKMRLYVRMGGGCQGCGAAKQTLSHTVTTMVRKRFPEIREIVDLTKHEDGKNPYICSN